MKNSFTITKFIQAKRAKVFEAWTSPELLKKWDCPEHCDQIALEQNIVTGGSYRNTMFDRESKEEVTVYGKYLDVINGVKLKFTSQWENDSAPETIVTVEFADKDGGTMITLSQEGFANEALAKGHEEGWASCLKKLADRTPEIFGSSSPLAAVR